jgi:hypothetical protein
MRHTSLVAVCGLALAVPALAQSWSNSGGNAQRNGQTPQSGPDAPTVLWTNPRSSVIAWLPLIDGRRVFTVRQTGFPPEPASGSASPIVALNLDTGTELWPAFQIPFASGDWTTYILGARDGKLYASRSGGGGAGTLRPIYAIDQATGQQLWVSSAVTGQGPYDGCVFAPNGDLVVGDFGSIRRIRATDGSLAWQTARSCSVSGTCGGAISVVGDAVYVADAAAGGTVIKRYNLDTGALQYVGPVMPGFTAQNTPLAGPGGRVFFSRSQNNPPTDSFYSFIDTGAALTQSWSTPAAWSTNSEFAVGTDGSAFFLAPGYVVERRDAAGSVIATSTVVGGNYAQRMGIDTQNRLYLLDGTFGVSRLHSFNPDLSLRWTAQIPGNVNIGGPAFGPDGTLVIATTTSIIAYRTPVASCYANCDQSTTPPVLNAGDFSCFLNAFRAAGSLPLSGQIASYANCDQSTTPPVLNAGDFSCFLNRFRAGCN